MENDPGDRVGEGTGQEKRPGEALTAEAGENQAGDAPNGATQQHCDDNRDIDAGLPPGKDFIQQAGNCTVGRQFEGHGNGTGEHSRHSEDYGAQKRRDQADGQAPRPAAQETAQQGRNMHGRQGGADLRDLSGEKGKNHGQRQEQRGISQFSDLEGCHQFFSPWVLMHL